MIYIRYKDKDYGNTQNFTTDTVKGFIRKRIGEILDGLDFVELDGLHLKKIKINCPELIINSTRGLSQIGKQEIVNRFTKLDSPKILNFLVRESS